MILRVYLIFEVSVKKKKELVDLGGWITETAAREQVHMPLPLEGRCVFQLSTTIQKLLFPISPKFVSAVIARWLISS